MLHFASESTVLDDDPEIDEKPDETRFVDVLSALADDLQPAKR